MSKKSKRYGVCNLRGGIGKTTLSFNIAASLSRRARALVVDSCPQENLTEILLRDHFTKHGTIKPNLFSALSAYLIQGTRLQQTNMSAKATGLKGSLSKYDLWVLPSSQDLYIFPNMLYSQLNMANTLPMEMKALTFLTTLTSLDNIISAEERTIEPDYTIIDTSPFFAGATHLVWHACEELIVPVRADHQSVVSLELLLSLLNDPNKEFLRYVSATENNPILKVPKIKMIVLTHCGWNRQNAGHMDESTFAFYTHVLRLIRQYPHLFVGFNSENINEFDAEDKIVPLDDFLTTSRISNEMCIPIQDLEVGKKFNVGGARPAVNQSVENYKNQLNHLVSKLV